MSTSKAVNYTSFVQYMAKSIISRMSKESWMPDDYKFSDEAYMRSAIDELFSTGGLNSFDSGVKDNKNKAIRVGRALSVRSAMILCARFLQYTGKIYESDATKKINNVKNPTKILSVKMAKDLVQQTIGRYSFTYVYSDNIGDLGQWKTYTVLLDTYSRSFNYHMIGGGGGGAGSVVTGGGKDCEFECETTAGSGQKSTLTIYKKSGDRDTAIEANNGTGAIVWHKHSGGGSSSGGAFSKDDPNTTYTSNTAGTWKEGSVTLYPGERIYASRGNGGDGGGGIAAVRSGKPSKTTTNYMGKIIQDYNEKLFAGGGGGGGFNGSQGTSRLYPANEITIHDGENGDKTTQISRGGHGSLTEDRVGVYAYGGEGGWGNYDDKSEYGGGNGGSSVGAGGGGGGASRKTDSYSFATGGGGGASGVIYGTCTTTLFIR